VIRQLKGHPKERVFFKKDSSQEAIITSKTIKDNADFKKAYFIKIWGSEEKNVC
jgi:hypothetical protein